MPKSFTADVKKFAELTKKNMRYVATAAIQDVVEAAQTPQRSVEQTGGSFEIGKIPVRDADLINSLASGINGVFGAESADSYIVTIAGYEIGDSMKFAWTAEHAMRIEAGFTGTDKKGREYNQAGRQFVAYNAALFSGFVETRTNEVRR